MYNVYVIKSLLLFVVLLLLVLVGLGGLLVGGLSLFWLLVFSLEWHYWKEVGASTISTFGKRASYTLTVYLR